jgi:hypothetical protein
MALIDRIRHPRRLGFILFNVIAITLIGLWIWMRSQSPDPGIADLPNIALSTVGIVVLVAVWAGAWIAWAVMVWTRRQRSVISNQ